MRVTSVGFSELAMKDCDTLRMAKRFLVARQDCSVPTEEGSLR